MAQAIVMTEYGGPEVLRLQQVEVGPPGPGQVRISQTRIGVNFHDVYVRSGLYKTLTLPGIPGIEAVGVVSDIGSGVTGLKTGDRVGYVSGAYGVYSSERLIDSNLLLSLPGDISDTQAASALLRGLTVEMLVNRVHQIRPGSFVLVHAAAGGVGQLLCQWATRLGARVIGTAGSDANVELAKAAGCEHVIRYRTEDVAARVREFTAGCGVSVAYDGVGKDTFAGSLDSLDFLGHLVNFGQASGAVPPIHVTSLATRSSTLSRPIIFHYLANSSRRRQMAENVFSALREGWLRVKPAREFALEDAAKSHQVLESEGASIPLLLVPRSG